MIVKPGWLNVGLDHLSRIETGEEPTSLEEGLSDAHLFVVQVADDHFVDIIQFLTIGTTLEGYSTKKNKELMVKVSDFYVYWWNIALIMGNLYNMGTDEILH